MAIRRATRTDIARIRQRLAELPNPPYLPSDDDVAGLFEDRNAVAVMGDAGEFGQAHWSEVNSISTIVHLLPHNMGVRQIEKLLLALFDALWEVPAAQTHIVNGRSPAAGTSDFGQRKADTIADLIKGRTGVRPDVAATFDSLHTRTGTRISMPLALARAQLRRSAGGN